jgi:hypothetical protein
MRLWDGNEMAFCLLVRLTIVGGQSSLRIIAAAAFPGGWTRWKAGPQAELPDETGFPTSRQGESLCVT